MLKQLGIPRKRKASQGKPHRVVILVENSEHAESLSKMLPDWDIYHTQPPPLPEEEPQGDGLKLGRIITWPQTNGRITRASILIRATGGCDLVEWVHPHSEFDAIRAGKCLIDFEDNLDAQAVAATKIRIRDYQHQQMEVMRPPDWPHHGERG